MFDENKSNSLFTKPISEASIQYLKNRNVVSVEYFEALRKGMFGILDENTIQIKGIPYAINCILGESKDSIYDIRGTNDLYRLDPSVGTAFSVLYGDDYLAFKPNDERVYFRSLSSDEEVLVAESYDDFINQIRMEDTNDEKSN